MYKRQGVTHETVRHREMSFMQESTRWCNYAKGRLGYKYGRNISIIEPPFKNEDSLEKFYDVVAGNEAIYQELTNDGEPAQLARSVLPTATKSDIYVSGTLDMLSLIHIFSLLLFRQVARVANLQVLVTRKVLVVLSRLITLVFGRRCLCRIRMLLP